MTLVKVKTLDGKTVWINPDHIISARLYNDYVSVQCTGDDGFSLPHDEWAFIDMKHTDHGKLAPVVPLSIDRVTRDLLNEAQDLVTKIEDRVKDALFPDITFGYTHRKDIEGAIQQIRNNIETIEHNARLAQESSS